MTTEIYHGGNLEPIHFGAEGLWATDDIAAARDYAKSTAEQSLDATAHVFRVKVSGRVAPLREVVPAELADRVENGEPAVLAYAGLATALAEQGIGAVLVETGDEHPGTYREHRSWWVVGDYATESVEEIQA